MIKSVELSIICFILLIVSATSHGQSLKVPGVVVGHFPAKTGIYIVSLSIFFFFILPNGYDVASHDYFGLNSTEHERALTAVYIIKSYKHEKTHYYIIDSYFLKNSNGLFAGWYSKTL